MARTKSAYGRNFGEKYSYFGANTLGHDVKMFGDTTGKYFMWDASANKIILAGDLDHTGALGVIGALTVGVNDTGHDVKFFGATSGKYFLWDESADAAIISGITQLGTTATAALALGGGTSASPLTTAVADKNFLGVWSQSTATSGDSRGLYLRHYAGGTIAATGFADAIRAFMTVTGTGYSSATGIHATMQINAAATVTGEGEGVRATLAAAAESRTLSGKLAAIKLESDIGANNTMPTIHGFMRFIDTGTIRMSNLAVIPVPSNGTVFATHVTEGMTHSIRIITETGTPYYIMCTNAATNRGT
jgi:hypothetical protein